MASFVVEIEYVLHMTYEVEADDSRQAEAVARKRLCTEIADEIEERDPIPEDFDVIEVAEQD